MDDEMYASFSAKLNGVDVRITVPLDQIDIVTRDNELSYDVEDNFMDLEDVEPEQVYEG